MEYLSFVLVIIATSFAEFPPTFVQDPLSDLPAGHLKKFGYHRPSDGPVAEERGFLHPKVFWERYVSIHKPMVFRQAVANSPAIVKWNDDYLTSNFGDLDLKLELKREDRATKDLKRVNMSLFIERYRKEDIYAVTVLPDPMREDVQVPSCLLCGTFRNFTHETNLWMSSGGTRSVIHYDADENLHCIMNGSKDFMMMENKFKQFLLMSQKKKMSGSDSSPLDPDSVDLLKYPDVAKVQWTYATLYPGDCIYIPSEYIHQVRSHKRTISATMLFTSDLNKSFQDTGCEDASFEYTPLSAIDVHWTYKKGDRTVDMGYMNIELLRKALIDILHALGKKFFTLKEFENYFLHSLDMEFEEEGVEASHKVKELCTKIFEIGPDGKVTEEQIRQLPRENLKILARRLEDAHGPPPDEMNEDPDFEDQGKDEL